MVIVEIKVDDLELGTSEIRTFNRSPIRIGRSSLATLPLARSFVSSFHGTLSFDTQTVRYVDFGSTNGTVMNRKRLAPYTRVEVSDRDELRVGPLLLTVAMKEAPDPEVLDFDADTPVKRRTVGAVLDDGKIDLGGARIDPTKKFEDLPETLRLVFGIAPRQLTTVDIHDDDEAGNDQEVAPTAESASPIAKRADESSTWPQAVADADPVALLEQAVRVIETFSKVFIELRQGYRSIGQQLGLEVLPGKSKLHLAREPKEIMTYLLDLNADQHTRLQQLVDIMGECMLHDIALAESAKLAVGSTFAPPGEPAQAKQAWALFVEAFAAAYANATGAQRTRI